MWIWLSFETEEALSWEYIYITHDRLLQLMLILRPVSKVRRATLTRSAA